MNLFHKTFAAALLCGAVGFAVPSFSATTDSSSSTAATTTDKGDTNATDTSTPAKPAKSAKRAVRPRIDEEHSIVEALNQKSLEGAQSGQSPDFAAAEPASHQQAEAAHATGKTVIRHRTNAKASAKKGA